MIAYQNDPEIWGKRVQYQLVADSGYPVYPETLTIRADRKEELSGCLTKLVPILQRSTAAYAADPGPTNQFISELVGKYPKALPVHEGAG